MYCTAPLSPRKGHLISFHDDDDDDEQFSQQYFTVLYRYFNIHRAVLHSTHSSTSLYIEQYFPVLYQYFTVLRAWVLYTAVPVLCNGSESVHEMK